MNDQSTVLAELRDTAPDVRFTPQETADGLCTFWVDSDAIRNVLRRLKTDIAKPYSMLYDLTAIDERARTHWNGQPRCDFTVAYQLYSFDRNEYVRIKVPLSGDSPSIDSVTGIWPAANWYERELWDMFGIQVTGHPDLKRILMPPWWDGHPLRKEHPARATEMEPFVLSEQKQREYQHQLQFGPEDWQLERTNAEDEFLYLNLGPQHPGTHGVLRVILKLDEERIVDAIPDIGFHHRGAEKMGERQSWHSYIPYTDRIDYLGGVMNNLAYLMALETLVSIEVPDRAKVIRVMMSELFRIASHLVWYGTFAQDLGAMSPVFYMFTDREHVLDIVAAICGGRMHPNWFRIGGVAQDLPEGWDDLMEDFLDYLPKRLQEYDKLVMRNRIFKVRTQGIGAYTREETIEGCHRPWIARLRPRVGLSQARGASPYPGVR